MTQLSPNAQVMAEHAQEATELLKALGHSARLMICCQLQEGELSVGQIEKVLNIHQPRLSRELAKLRTARLVKTRRESKSIFYSLADDRAERLIDGLKDALAVGKANGKAVNGNAKGKTGKSQQNSSAA